MQSDGPSRVTELLKSIASGDRRAVDVLMPMVYDELRRVAGSYLSQESPGATIDATGLVHQAYLKLCSQEKDDWQSRSQFLAVGSQAMRRILVDQARKRKAEKRGGNWTRIEMHEDIRLSSRQDEDVLALDAALQKLAGLDERMAQSVEMRFFAGMTVEEVAQAMGVSKSTVEKDWTMARAWLRRELSDETDTQEKDLLSG